MTSFRETFFGGAGEPRVSDIAAMLTEIYIEALLVEDELADQIWEAWYCGDADDETACIAWMLTAYTGQ